MTRYWRIWGAFAACLAVGLAAMAWLTVRAVELDRQQAAAQRQAADARRKTERQERITVALWRMDSTLAPLIAQEAARPSFHYRPLISVEPASKARTKRGPTPSPLLDHRPRHVILHFDVSADGGWVSPQIPPEDRLSTAALAASSLDELRKNRRQLEQLKRGLSFEQLLARIPATLLSSSALADGEPGNQTEQNGPLLSGYQQRPVTDESPKPASPHEHSATQATPSQLAPSQQSAAREQQQSPFQSESQSSRKMASGPRSQAPNRGQQEWLRRNEGVQNIARSQRAQIVTNSLFLPQSPDERQGVSRAVWLGDKLILARRIMKQDEVRIQGCWLDWPRIKNRLRQEVADLFDDVQLLPVTDEPDVPTARLLATLPVRLGLPPSPLSESRTTEVNPANRSSAIRTSLIVAWCCLLAGSLAVGVMLAGTLALSDRRAAFVSAVTHELRSPLTTLRMYTEMLSEGMVRDAARRERYLHTIRDEADRLAHLVENVLYYARLERGQQPGKRMQLSLQELIEQTTDRLPGRAEQVGMELYQQQPELTESAFVWTDPAAVEQILFNLVDNACKYASSAEDRRIHLRWSLRDSRVYVRVSDHGPGLSAAQQKKLFRPFSKTDEEAAHSSPGIGLGLALCRRLAEAINGCLRYEPQSTTGAHFVLELPLAQERNG